MSARTANSSKQWRSEGPAGPATAGGPAVLKGPARGPPGRSSRRNPLVMGPNKLFAGGPENRRYATASKLKMFEVIPQRFPFLNMALILSLSDCKIVPEYSWIA